MTEAAPPPPEPARDAEAAPAEKKLPLSLLEFVPLIALLTALNALAINIMLPALGDIGDAFAIENPNDRQLVIVFYLVCAGLAQVVYGPLMDRFGRRPVLLGALAGYLIGSTLCLVATSFSLLLVARAFQGVTTAAARIAAIAIVRDVASGRRMAEIMSLTTSVFMLVPILAPGLGQLILLWGPWRWVFAVLLAYGVIMLVWAWFRIPETLPKENRTPLQPRRIAASYAQYVSNRTTLGYTIASAFMFGGFFGFINSSEQIYVETFHVGAMFPIALAGSSIAMTAATLLNAKLVGRFGMRRLSHAAVVAFFVSNALHAAIGLLFGEGFWTFAVFMALAFFLLGLMMPNFNAVALEPMGRIAGVASAAFGFANMTISALLGAAVGRLYDGTATPVVIGLAVFGAIAFLVLLITERGRLFEPHPAPSRD